MSDAQTGEGTLEYVYVYPGKEDRFYTGTFTSNQEQISMQYNNQSFNNILRNVDSKFYFIQDLTAHYKAKYPSGLINQVAVISPLLLKK